MAEKELPFPEGYYPFDKGDMKKHLDEFPNQVREGLTLVGNARVQKSDHIIYFGMGASGISGDILRTYFSKTGIDVQVIKNYDLPEHIPQNAILIFSSYSGNTEEVLSCYKQAVRTYKNLISISCGGKLEDLAKSNRTQHILIPKGLPPRMTLGYQFFAILTLLEKAGLTNAQAEIKGLLKNLDPQKLAKMGIALSTHLKDNIPIIYSSGRYYPVAYRWKCQINENAKIMAFSNEFSELNHNEIMGYTFIRGNFYGIILKFDDDHRRIQKRMELMKAIMKRSGVEVTEIALKGSLLTKIFTGILIGDYTAYFLALRYRIDPSPNKLIDKFKADLGPFI